MSFANEKVIRSLLACSVILCNLLVVRADAGEKCLLADIPPTPVLPPDLPALVTSLERLQDQHGDRLLRLTSEDRSSLDEIFVQSKTKLGQFFQLLYWIQNQVGRKSLPIEVLPPGITRVLLASRVFTDESFPKKIRSVRLASEDGSPRFTVQLDAPEVRFPINRGVGFAAWDQGMCQTARVLVFYDGFSFRLRKARNSRNLVVDAMRGVQLFGEFGSRVLFKIDLNYVDLEKVEFIEGTDEGKVTCRVARREFSENKHSALFRFIGSLIPSTSRQRIDW